MIRSKLMIAAVLGGPLVLGCEKKDETTVPAKSTTPATPTTPAAPEMPTTPAAPTTQSMKESAKAATQGAANALRNATTRPAAAP
jgi:hypothetical protein